MRRSPRSPLFPYTTLFRSPLRARAKRRVLVRCEASRIWCSSPPSDELSSTGLCGARASALRQLTSRRLSERSERSERSEFGRSEEHTSELQSLRHLVCRLL